MKAVSLLLSLLASVNVAADPAVENISVLLNEGRSLVVSKVQGEKANHITVVYISGSSTKFHAADLEFKKDLLGDFSDQVNFMVINKPGVSEDGTVDEAAFKDSFLRERRIEDYLTALQKAVSKDDKILLVGYSEGAYLAPFLALADKRISRMALIAGGTRGWLTEELNKASADEREMVSRQVEAILGNQSPNDLWYLIPFSAWRSFNVDPLEALQAVQVPTLAIQAEYDQLVDVKTSVRELLDLAKRGRPIDVAEVQGVGHDFEGAWGQINSRLRQFFASEIGNSESPSDCEQKFLN